VVRALVKSGAFDAIAGQALSPMFEELYLRLSEPRVSSIARLRDMAGQAGALRFAMELSVLGYPVNFKTLHAEHCSGSGFHYLSRVQAHDPARRYWCVPMELQARHSCTAHDMTSGTPQGAKCLSAYRSLERDWIREEMDAMAAFFDRNEVDAIRFRHITAFLSVRKELNQRGVTSHDRLDNVLSRTWSMRLVVQAWKDCRTMLKNSERRR